MTFRGWGCSRSVRTEKAWIDFGAKVVLPKRVHLNNWNPWINSNWLMVTDAAGAG